MALEVSCCVCAANLSNEVKNRRKLSSEPSADVLGVVKELLEDDFADYENEYICRTCFRTAEKLCALRKQEKELVATLRASLSSQHRATLPVPGAAALPAARKRPAVKPPTSSGSPPIIVCKIA